MELQFLLSLSVLYLVAVNAKPTQDERLELSEPKLEDFPKDFDWRTKKAVTKVRDQGEECERADWAFAAIGAIETELFKTTGHLEELSVQELLDCTKNTYMNYGCYGGSIQAALRYIAENGISTEKSYKYRGHDSKICSNVSKAIAKGAVIKGKEVPPLWEIKMVQEIATKGPIMAMVDVQQSLADYTGGIYDEKKCKSVGNHNVLIVGYGVTENSEKYWIVKNSWGAEWGEAGYFRIARGNNVCGIEMNIIIIDKFELPKKL